MFRRKRKYTEAYLEIKRGKIKEKEKTRREELGSGMTSYDIAVEQLQKRQTAGRVSEEEADKDGDAADDLGYEEEREGETLIEDGFVPAEMEEDARIVERPASRTAWYGFVFWVLFLFSSVQFFIPQLQTTLNRTIDYSELWGDQNFTKEKDDTGNKKIKSEPKDKSTNESDTPTTPPNAMVEQIQKTAPEVWEGTKRAVETIQEETTTDDARLFAHVHGLIAKDSVDLRDTTSRYVTRQGHHVELVALGGKIQTDMSQARSLLSGTEENDLHHLLLVRVERLESLGLRLNELDRTTAIEVVNEYIREENTSSKLFIEQLAEKLDAEGREYTLKGDVFEFE